MNELISVDGVLVCTGDIIDKRDEISNSTGLLFRGRRSVVAAFFVSNPAATKKQKLYVRTIQTNNDGWERDLDGPVTCVVDVDGKASV